MIATVLAGWAAAAALMALLWDVQRRRGTPAIVDVAWSLATAGLGAWFALAAQGLPARRYLIAALAAAWGVRLGSHLWRRLARGHEDGRYTQLQRDWAGAAGRRMFGFFQLQGLWAVLFALPMLAAASNAAPLGLLDLLGLTLWSLALAGEGIADAQLAAFKADPRNRGRVLRGGLWRYSRHPNYFFEWLHWWAYLAFAAGSPLWWVAALGVAVMYLFLTRVTGIPPTEAQAIRSRGEAYREYQRTTSAFVPWRPRPPLASSSPATPGENTP